MSTSVSMTYGGSGLVPVPLVNLGKQYNKAGDSQNIGVINTLTLNGTISAVATGGGAGITNLLNAQKDLRGIFSSDGLLFQILCDSSVIFETYPRVNNLSFQQSNDNWVNTIPYTIELDFDTEPVDSQLSGSGEDSDTSLVPPFLNSASENWTIEPIERQPYTWELTDPTRTDKKEIAFNVKHDVQAEGRRSYIAGVVIREGWEEAQAWVTPRLGFDATKVSDTLVFNINGELYTEYNHVRSNVINELDGTFGVTESWVYMAPTTASGEIGNVLEDFTVTVANSLLEPITKININGTIRGLDTISYGTASGEYSLTESKDTAANNGWIEVSGKLLGRAIFASSGLSVNNRSINPTPLFKSVGRNPTQGVITYSYEYDDRACNFVVGSLFESIVVQDSNPIDVFAELTVLGRTSGPILQQINTVTSFKRNVAIDVIVQPSGGCDDFSAALSASPKTNVETLLCEIETDLAAAYGQLFKSQDNESWDVKTGKYNRQVQWTATNCGTAVDTSFC